MHLDIGDTERNASAIECISSLGSSFTHAAKKMYDIQPTDCISHCYQAGYDLAAIELVIYFPGFIFYSL